jgi:hypothetical protein
MAIQVYPSNKCSGCGWLDAELILSDRTVQCEVCGLVLDRDLNAAISLGKLAGSLSDSQNACGAGSAGSSREAGSGRESGSGERSRPRTRATARGADPHLGGVPPRAWYRGTGWERRAQWKPWAGSAHLQTAHRVASWRECRGPEHCRRRFGLLVQTTTRLLAELQSFVGATFVR